MKTALISLSAQGARTLEPLAHALSGTSLFVHQSAQCKSGKRFPSLVALTRTLFPCCQALVYAAPCGAVMRAVAPCLVHKTSDPAVVVLDVGARFAISLVSGHEGGANALAITVANILGAEPVLTTTSEAVKDIIVGVGCRRGVAQEQIVQAVKSALEEVGFGLKRVRFLASADRKHDEVGLVAAAQELNVPLRLIASAEIRAATRTFTKSELAEKKVNLPAVAEPAALLAGRRTQLALSRRVINGVTVAVAKEDLPWSELDQAAFSTAPDAPSRP